MSDPLPALPDIDGIDTFRGHTIHTACWDHDCVFYDFAGKRVAVLGTGASAVRIIPELVRTAKSVKVFQRTPSWVLPRGNRQVLLWAHEILVQALAKAYLRLSVKDSWLRRQLTPDFRLDRTRLLMTSDYYPALQQENCKLITWPIYAIAPNGVRTAEGVEHEVDCIVFETGIIPPAVVRWPRGVRRCCPSGADRRGWAESGAGDSGSAGAS